MRLIVLLNHFPFGKGEEFFESELPYLVNNFDKIIIYSEGKGEQTRVVPANVEIVHLQHIGFFKMLWFLFISGLNMFSHDAFDEYKIIMRHYKKGITFHKLSRILWFFFRGQIIKSYLKNIDFSSDETILYSYWLHTPAFAIAELNYPRVKKISRAHGYDLYTFRQKEDYLPFRKFIYSNLDGIFFISSKGMEYYKKRFSGEFEVSQEKLTLSRLGVRGYGVQQETNSSEYFNLISCSSIIELKRLDLIIDALESIKDAKINWVHIGEGNLSKQIKKYAFEKLGPKSNIKYLFLGSLENKEVISYYSSQAIDLFINTSDSEGVPVSIMEAMSFSIPVVARDIGGISEIVNDKNGKLLRSTPQLTEISIAILEFIRLKQSREIVNFRVEAQRTWAKQYNSDKNYADFVRLLSGI